MSFWKKNKQDGSYTENPEYQRDNDNMQQEDNFGGDYEQDSSNVFSMNGRRGYGEPFNPNENRNYEDDSPNMKLIICKPTEYEQSQTIIDYLKNNKTIVVNLTEIETPVAQRILDFIYGGVYALGGDLKKAGPNMFVLAPSNVELTNASEENNNDDVNEE